MEEQTELQQVEEKESYIDAFIRINDKIKELNDEKRALITEINEIKNSENSNLQLPLIKQNEDGTWTRVTLKDNQDAHETGYYVFAWAERYTVEVKVLKNKPKV